MLRCGNHFRSSPKKPPSSVILVPEVTSSLRPALQMILATDFARRHRQRAQLPFPCVSPAYLTATPLHCPPSNKAALEFAPPPPLFQMPYVNTDPCLKEPNLVLTFHSRKTICKRQTRSISGNRHAMHALASESMVQVMIKILSSFDKLC